MAGFALVFAFDSSAIVFALAFDSCVMAAFALAFESSAFAFALAFDSNAFDWNQMRNKCESNATILQLLHNGYFVSLFRLE